MNRVESIEQAMTEAYTVEVLAWFVLNPLEWAYNPRSTPVGDAVNQLGKTTGLWPVAKDAVEQVKRTRRKNK